MTSGSTARPTVCRVDLDTLAANFHSARRYVGSDYKYLAVVKADAYGHGAIECSRRLEREGVDWLGVALPEEGIELRKAGITAPVLCLGSFWPGQEAILLDHGLTPVVADIEMIERLAGVAAERGKSVDVHLKTDTGMHRLGFDWRSADRLVQACRSLPNIRVTGLMTHFASADDPGEDDFTRLQMERFVSVLTAFRSVGIEPELIDLANSPGAIRHPDSRPNLVRLGGALYGLLDDILPDGADRPDLRPVLSLRSKIANLNKVQLGESIGYGRTFTTERDSVIAAVPIGYADGYRRGLSNRAKASVNGRMAPVVGRVSMDWTLLDVTDVSGVAIGDDVFLIGGESGAEVKAADLAAHLGTISYEITCGISGRVPRVFAGAKQK